MEYRGHSSDPDPLDMFVLVLQDRHRSHLVDSGQVYMYMKAHNISLKNEKFSSLLSK